MWDNSVAKFFLFAFYFDFFSYNEWACLIATSKHDQFWSEACLLCIFTFLAYQGLNILLNILQSQGKQDSLADEFEFVMHGLLYKISEAKSRNTEV